MKANLEKRTIELSKSEAKAAGIIESDEFDALMRYKEAYPTFTIVIKAPAKRKNEYKGLTYKYMVEYIKKHDDEEKTIMTEFNTLTAQDKKNKKEDSENLEAASYLDVRAWFLSKFPEIENYRNEHRKQVDKILGRTA